MSKATRVRMRGRALKRVLVLLALCALGILASTTVAQAQVVNNETVSYAYSGFVPCANGGAGEFLTGRIDVHNLITSTENGHVDSWQFQSQPQGSLVGRITGDTYRLTGVTRGTYNDILPSGEYTLTYVNSYQLIGPGPANDLRVREIAHVTINGDDVVVQHDDLSIECT
jgi:hypothetical protein